MNPSLRPRARGTTHGHLTHTRYIGDATVHIEHLGDHDYEVEIVLPRSQRDSEWESIITAPGAGRDPNDESFIDRVAATAVKLAVTDEGLEDIADATAWAIDGQGGYEVLKGNPENPRRRRREFPPINEPRFKWYVVVRTDAIGFGGRGSRAARDKIYSGWETKKEAQEDTRSGVWFGVSRVVDKATAIAEGLNPDRYSSWFTASNPAGLTAKGERMYEHVKERYAGDPRAKEIASRTVLARAGEGAPGLKKNPRGKINQKGYKWYVIFPVNGLIESGWEYKEDAKDQADQWNEATERSGGGYKWYVISKRALSASIDPDNNSSWMVGPPPPIDNPLSATEAGKVRDMFRGKKNPWNPSGGAR